MGIEKASGDGGAKDGGEVSLEGAREVAPAAKAALELQRKVLNDYYNPCKILGPGSVNSVHDIVGITCSTVKKILSVQTSHSLVR